MGLPIVIQPGIEPGSVVTPVALRCSALDRCSTREPYSILENTTMGVSVYMHWLIDRQNMLSHLSHYRLYVLTSIRQAPVSVCLVLNEVAWPLDGVSGQP